MAADIQHKSMILRLLRDHGISRIRNRGCPRARATNLKEVA